MKYGVHHFALAALFVLVPADAKSDRIRLTFELEVTAAQPGRPQFDPTKTGDTLKLEFWYDDTLPKWPFRIRRGVVTEEFPGIHAALTQNDGPAWTSFRPSALGHNVESMAITFGDNISSDEGVRDQILLRMLELPDGNGVQRIWEEFTFVGSDNLFDGELPTSFKTDEMLGLERPFRYLNVHQTSFRSFDFEVRQVPEPARYTAYGLAFLVMLARHTRRVPTFRSQGPRSRGLRPL